MVNWEQLKCYHLLPETQSSPAEGSFAEMKLWCHICRLCVHPGGWATRVTENFRIFSGHFLGSLCPEPPQMRRFCSNQLCVSAPRRTAWQGSWTGTRCFSDALSHSHPLNLELKSPLTWSRQTPSSRRWQNRRLGSHQSSHWESRAELGPGTVGSHIHVFFLSIGCWLRQEDREPFKKDLLIYSFYLNQKSSS